MIETLKKVCGDIKLNESMSLHTTFKTGGPADYFITPKTTEELKNSIKTLKDNNIEYIILGNGSNVLVGDKGIRGAVIMINDSFSDISFDGESVNAGAGVILSTLSKACMENSLTGLEFASGIPGTLGGAIYMNAGAYGGEMKDVVKSVCYLDDNGEIKTLSVDELLFGYRTSFFKNKSYVILNAKIDLKMGEKKKIKEEMAELTKKRVSKQPLNFPSAGSTFKRPEGYFAGALIEEAGLKGYRIGGASVSEKHAGFVVNDKDATSKDILNLIEHIKKTVYENSLVELEPEVKLIGEF